MLDAGWRFRFGWCGLAFAIGLSALGAVDDAGAQQRVAGSRVVVTGEGSISVAPDVVQIRSGVSTRGKTVREAAETNSKTMAAILTALTESGIPQKDVRTAQLSIQPVYAAQEPGKEQKLVGYSVANHVSAKIKHVEKLGDVLDRLIAAGATEVWNVEFLVSDPAKVLDQAREAAIADARRKAEVYARAAGVPLGRVVSIEEESGASSPMPMRALAQPAPGAHVPIAPGENTLRAVVSVAFEIAR
ncbi:MAG TPA: SIMPL domain-containing protein [Xanthobacteraceae bacterium]